MPTEFRVDRVETGVGPVALVTIAADNDRRPPVFGRAALESLERALAELEDGEWKAMVLTGSGAAFSAGADLDEFPLLRSRDDARAASRAGQQLFARIRTLPYPTVAAINGTCLGGGLELALHCNARTVSSEVRQLGQPEVFLGLVPGWGGTQLAPRLVGAKAAVRLIVSNPLRQNRMLTGAEAHELALADRLLEPSRLVEDSIALAVELAERGGPDRRPVELGDTADVVRRARAQVDDAVHGAAPAPYRALELIEGAADWSLEEGLRREADIFAELVLTPQARASLYAFDVVERRAKRRRPAASPRAVTKVGIVGAGLMATQLATLFLRRLEVPIVLRDLEQRIVDDALATIRADVATAVAKGRYDEERGRTLESLVSGGTSFDGWDDVSLVIEAVFEDLDVKKRVFAEVEELVGADCVLATNTSALSVTAMAADLRHPERVVGMHFFNPVAVMPLVEVVRAPATDDQTVAIVWEVAERLRKRPVLVRDAPGFVVNRLLTRMTSTLMRALERGNSVEETDEAVLRLGLPMAPSVLLAMVGPRVANHVLETMHAVYPDRFPLSPTLAGLADGREPPPARRTGALSVDAIAEAVLEALADEVHHLLEEGVVETAADVDACLLLGAGFPFFLGGITKHLDQTGVSERVVGRPLAEVRAAAPA